MKTFYVISNKDKDPDGKFFEKIRSMFEERDVLVKRVFDGSNVEKDCDAVIVLGGDGTMLRAARHLYGTDIPLIGINTGTLGYLTEISDEKLTEGIDALANGNYRTEERMMLEGRVIRDGVELYKDVALNDVAIIRKGKLRIMRFINYVNGKMLSAFNADGVLVVTPTGSTGYSLSAGGPVISPDASIIAITAIASHTINTRSIILSDKDVVEIEIGADRTDNEYSAVACFDGEESITLKTGDRIEIKKADESTRMIKIFDDSFLDVLRAKMQMT